MKIIIFKTINGSNVAYNLNDKTVAEIWRIDSPSQWHYKINPTYHNGWTDRSQDAAMSDVEHMLTRNLNIWGFTVEFVKRQASTPSMKSKSWKQIDAQYVRLLEILNQAIVDRNMRVVESKIWLIVDEAWNKAHDNIARLQNAKFRYCIPDENKQYTRKEYMGY